MTSALLKENKLGASFTKKSLFWFAFPSLVLAVFWNFYGLVDGIFIARFIGALPLSALNMFWPIWSIEYGISTMFAYGGSAMIAKRMGEGQNAAARSLFTGLVLVMALVGGVLALIGNVFCREINVLSGMTALQMPYGIEYARVHYWFMPVYFMQTVAQVFFVTAGRPWYATMSMVCAGILNMLLDYVFIAVCGWGMAGASLATVLSWMVPALAAIVFFLRKKGTLYFVKPKIKALELARICYNGASEFVTNAATGLVGILVNITFLKFYGENGIVALMIVYYFDLLFSAVYFGYSSGVEPIISYKFGQKNWLQLKFVNRSNLLFIGLFSVFAYGFASLLTPLVLPVFIDKASAAFALVQSGSKIYYMAFLLMGMNIYASALFTALSNGFASAVISFCRTCLFVVGSIILLPRIIGETGLWLSVPMAECLSIAVSFAFLMVYRKKYRY